MRTRIHVSLAASDLDASVRFYETLLGHPPTKVRPDYANFRLDEPALHLALVAKPDAPARADGQHFGVELFDDGDLAAWRERVTGAGLPVRVEERVTCCYAVADKFWARDPDGNEWELWVRHGEAEAMRAGAAEDACCAPAPMPLTTLEGLPPAPEGGCC